MFWKPLSDLPLTRIPCCLCIWLPSSNTLKSLRTRVLNTPFIIRRKQTIEKIQTKVMLHSATIINLQKFSLVAFLRIQLNWHLFFQVILLLFKQNVWWLEGSAVYTVKQDWKYNDRIAHDCVWVSCANDCSQQININI